MAEQQLVFTLGRDLKVKSNSPYKKQNRLIGRYNEVMQQQQQQQQQQAHPESMVSQFVTFAPTVRMVRVLSPQNIVPPQYGRIVASSLG